MVLSPDDRLVGPDGRYLWTPSRVYAAWLACLDDLELALPDAQVLILMVGLPGAGKSTWLREHMVAGPIYFDATLTDPRTRRGLFVAARRYERPVDVVWLDTAEAVCRERNGARPAERRVPDDVISGMAAALQRAPPTLQEGFRSVLRLQAGSRHP